MIYQEGNPSASCNEMPIESGLIPACQIQEFEDAVRKTWHPNALEHGFWNSATEDGNKITIHAFETDSSSSVRGRVNNKVVSEIEVVDDPGQIAVTIKSRTRGFMYIADKGRQDVRFYTSARRKQGKMWEETAWEEDTERSAEYNAASMKFWLIGPGSYDFVFMPNKDDKLVFQEQSVKITG